MEVARYLKRLLKRIPEQVSGQDRIWYALAAYNVGFGHVMDARMLATQLGKDPDLWVSLKEVLPLLSKKQYYRSLPHGYARGNRACSLCTANTRISTGARTIAGILI